MRLSFPFYGSPSLVGDIFTLLLFLARTKGPKTVSFYYYYPFFSPQKLLDVIRHFHGYLPPAFTSHESLDRYTHPNTITV